MRRPKLKLDNLIAFLTLAETGDFNRAADELGVTLSTLRKQMESIQDTVGSRLFHIGNDVVPRLASLANYVLLEV